MAPPPVSRRSGGHAARKTAHESATAQINPCPPGQRGGQYKPLTQNDVEQVYTTAVRILAEIGMQQAPEVLQQKALEKGASINQSGRLIFSKLFIEDVIDGAAKSFVLHGRDSKHDIEIGGDRVYFGTGGAAVKTLDINTGTYRPSTLRDLYDFTRLADAMTNVSWFTRCCVATEVTDIFDLDINTAYALIKGTSKPIGTSFTLGKHIAPVVEMFDITMGGTGKFARRPFCKAHISPIISPLKYGEDAVDVTLACIEQGMPINAVVAAQSGATAPATLAGALAQSTAEILAALIMVNVFKPGYPMIFSNWPFVVDLRTGSFSGAGGEISVMNAASAQIGNWMGLPTGVASSMADAKAVDAQMGSEKAIAALCAGLAGSNMIYESSGMMASLLGVSFEAFVLDDEMLSHIYRTIRGIEVNEQTLGFEAIRNAITGPGHFLGEMHTMEAMQRDYFYPKLADRNPPATWEEQGAKNIRSTARQRAKTILATHFPRYIDDAADNSIRKRFNILLD